ncbi:hypothetical protein EG68_12651, partial [Paragonimus skrjabini miyazakii]
MTSQGRTHPFKEQLIENESISYTSLFATNLLTSQCNGNSSRITPPLKAYHTFIGLCKRRSST